MKEHIGYCYPGCTCKRHRKCERGCRCGKHDLESRKSQSKGQLAYNESAERVTCEECGAGPFLGQRGLTTHKRVSPAHGGHSPRLGTGRKKAT